MSPTRPTTTDTLTALDPATLERHLFQNYRRAPVAFARGEGCRLYGTDGRPYLDFLAGIATSSLGHAHPRLVNALSSQAARYLHVSNLYHIPEQSEAARRLTEATQGLLERAFFCNSGTEAVEAAIKLARKWGSTDGRFEIVVAEGGFHGRTLGALAATATPAYHQGFEPLPRGFRAVPFDDLEQLESAIGDETCGVLLEAMQGEGGVRPASGAYLEGVQRICRERRILLILDEVQTGIGRTGSMFAFQHYALEPDVVTLAKGLGGGVPVGAVLAREELGRVLQPGDHGSTFGGNPLAMSAVIAVQQALVDDGLLDHAARMGKLLRSRLERLAEGSPKVCGVRGLGLLQALVLDPQLVAAEIVARCLELGLLVNPVRPDAIRLAPPLVVTEEEIDEGLAILKRALSLDD